MLLQEFLEALHEHRSGVFASQRQHVLAMKLGADVATPQDRAEGLLDIFGLALLHHDHRALADAELRNLIVDERIGHIQDVKRNGGFTVDVREAEELQRAQDAVVHAALEDDADIALCRPKV